ncbi:MAG: UDP-3-O-(3-hydroxymyristoyl)glucosamine N-acyltransferase [Rhodobacteraceae bacterium]|nr:MAG: UDP-3-O-(3-hydroxymyristoyl)glucosamine N-acyltransferase [Paracoccaceae bacterium]
MRLTLAQIARALDAEVAGDAAIEVTRPAHPAEAGPEDLALAFDARHMALLARGAARVAALPVGADWRALGLEGALFLGRPRHALAGLTARFDRPPAIPVGRHPAAWVHESAEVAPDARIGPFCAVHAGARIGAGATLVDHVSVGEAASVGDGSLLHAGVRVGARVRIGARAIIHPNAVIGADGFSFVTPTPGAVESAKTTGRVDDAARNMTLARIHSLGAVTVGDDVEIGAGSCIDRGTLADTRIGDGTKLDNLVQIGHNVRVGAGCMLCAQVGVAGSAIIGDRVVLGGQAGVADHVKIGADSVVAAKAGVGSNAPPRSVLLGAPALPRDEALSLMMATRRLPRLAETVRSLKKRLSGAGPTG